jgi:hypothetical protein
VVLEEDDELHVTLAYLDPPRDGSAKYVLFADLDLVVVGPNGSIAYGNEVQDGDAFATNEKAVIDDGPGEYIVSVIANTFPIESVIVPFAIAVSHGTVSQVGQIASDCIGRGENGAICDRGHWKCTGAFAGSFCNRPVVNWAEKKADSFKLQPKEVAYVSFVRPSTSEPGINFKRGNENGISRGVGVCVGSEPFSKLADPGVQCVTDVYAETQYEPLYIELPGETRDRQYWGVVYCISNVTCGFTLEWESGDRKLRGLSAGQIVGIVLGAVALATVIIVIIWYCCCRESESETGTTSPEYKPVL